MAGAGTGGRDERFGVTAAEARRRQIAAPSARPALRLLAPPDPPESGQSAEQARLLGTYNLYNG
jgi:hypothetical protein